jgi:hypothetical protein
MSYTPNGVIKHAWEFPGSIKVQGEHHLKMGGAIAMLDCRKVNIIKPTSWKHVFAFLTAFLWKIVRNSK